jgi:nucleotide-binding universal stress UspA family protein
MTWKLLVPVDLHEERPVWIDHALRLTRALEGKLILLHVVDYLSVSTPSELPDVYPIPPLRLMTEPAEARLAKMAESYEDLDIETVITSGTAAETIVSAAQEHEVDGIVIGSHSRKGLARMILGSVAERVARLATCPVTIVPAPRTE